MLRTRLKHQLIALAVATLVAASLTVWSGWATFRATVMQTQILELRTAVQEVESSVHEQGFHLFDYVGAASADVRERIGLDALTADRALAKLSNAESVVGKQAVTDLKHAHAQHAAAMAALLDLTQAKQALLAEVIASRDRIDAMLSEEQIPRTTRQHAPRRHAVAKMEIKYAKLIRELGLYLRTSNRVHFEEAEQSATLYGVWEGAYRKLAVTPEERAWLAALSAEANQTTEAVREIGALAGGKFDGLDRLKRAQAHIHQILDQRVQPDLEKQLTAAKMRQEQAFGVAVGSVVLVLLVLMACGMVMFGVRERLKSGLRPLLQLSERIGAGDLTSRIEPSAAADEFQQLGKAMSQMRDELRENTVSLDVLRQAQEENRRLAHFDVLTGLVNRGRFQQLLEQSIKPALRRGEKRALLYVDLDGFKEVNDRLGHEQGDLLLTEVGHRLKREVRETEVVARLGGDEFCMLLVDVDDEGRAAAQMAQRCIDVLRAPLYLQGTAVSMLCSIGIAIYPTDATEPYELLRCADMAMYEAKKAGRHHYAFYDATMTEAVNERLATEAALRVAVSGGELELHYQPQVSLISGRMVGVEALVRWRRPEIGLVAPDVFISLAEQIGVIGEIGGWVLEAACRQAVAWEREGLPPMLMAVNISSSHFEAPAFVESVARVLRESGMAPQRLEIEITESLTRDPERHALICRALQEQGVRVAIDDFGVGYSSLSVLTRMPINTMKLDRQFVHNLTSDARAIVMTGTIISMAAGLHFGVVAEGVETREQLQVLTGLGCAIAQGYYFCPPLPGDQIPAFAHVDFRVRSAEVEGVEPMMVNPIRALPN
ncbi:MAG: EAL domain-containing protein [Pseudomonadota bacterium]